MASPHLGLQALEVLGPVLPLADAAQAVHVVGEGFRKVRPVLERLLVALDGLVVPRGVLVRRRQVGVRLRALRLQARHLLVALDGLRRPPLRRPVCNCYIS